MNICKINKVAFSSYLDNENLIHIQVKSEDKKISTSEFQALKDNFQQHYLKEKSPQKKAKLAYRYIKKLSKFSSLIIKYNAVIKINCSLAYSLYVYVKTEQADTVWHSKLIPSEDIKLVGPLLHNIISHNASN